MSSYIMAGVSLTTLISGFSGVELMELSCLTMVPKGKLLNIKFIIYQPAFIHFIQIYHFLSAR